MVGLVPTIHPTVCSGVRGGLDPRDKPEDDNRERAAWVPAWSRARPIGRARRRDDGSGCRSRRATSVRAFQQAPRDDLRLDFGSTLEDVENTRVTQYPAHGILQRKAVAAMNL